MPFLRVGRPGLLGTMARTAVVAGTATMTANAVNRRQHERYAEQQAYAEQQQAQAQPQAQQQAVQQQAAQQPPPGDDLVARLTQLASLHSSGALSDAEFAEAKAKLIS